MQLNTITLDVHIDQIHFSRQVNQYLQCQKDNTVRDKIMNLKRLILIVCAACDVNDRTVCCEYSMDDINHCSIACIMCTTIVQLIHTFTKANTSSFVEK